MPCFRQGKRGNTYRPTTNRNGVSASVDSQATRRETAGAIRDGGSRPSAKTPKTRDLNACLSIFPFVFFVTFVVPRLQFGNPSSQRNDGLEKRELAQRAVATPLLRHRLGSSKITPLNASQQANEAATRVPVARGLRFVWQLAAERSAKLLADYRGGFCESGRGGKCAFLFANSNSTYPLKA